jgi:drug/metabolite transporter (DMT)-like permease
MPHGGDVVFFVGFAAAVCLAVGYVLQQRVAAHSSRSALLSYRLLWELMHKPVWWGGIAAMVVGQILGGLALDLGSVALVEPMLSSSLLFAFLIAATLSHERVRPLEVIGAVLVSAALGLFIAIGNPRSQDASDHPGLGAAVLAGGVVAVVVLALVAVGRRRGLVAESVLLATGAGLLYGLQDAGTRYGLVVGHDSGIGSMLVNPWVYVVVIAAVAGLVLSQSAFRAARLDYSLPPIAVAEPVAGIALGVTLLGDEISVTVLGLAVEAACVAAMIVGVALIARSQTLARCGLEERPVDVEPMLAAAR